MGAWYRVQNGNRIDIHERIVPPGEAPRERTIATDLSRVDADRIVALSNWEERSRRLASTLCPYEHCQCLYLSAGIYRGYPIVFGGGYSCPQLKLYGYARDTQLYAAIRRTLKARGE